MIQFPCSGPLKVSVVMFVAELVELEVDSSNIKTSPEVVLSGRASRLAKTWTGDPEMSLRANWGAVTLN
jgi:hypothetical protein